MYNVVILWFGNRLENSKPCASKLPIGHNEMYNN